MISKKGSFSQVIKPISEEVIKPFLKNWVYWGDVECDFEQIREGGDLVGFYIDVVTSRGKYRYKFKRKIDTDGYYRWIQVSVSSFFGV